MSYTLRNLAIAAVLGVLGLILTMSYLNSQRDKITSGQERVKVLVAKETIPAGTSASTLESGGFIETTEIVSDDRAPQVLSDLKPVEKESTNSTIYAGEQLTAHRFAGDGELAASDSIKGTQRQLTIKLGATESNGGSISPGDRIDVVATVADGATQLTYLVARDVLVVQTPSSRAGSGEPAAQVTADSPPQLYTVVVSDATAMDLVYAMHKAGEQGLFALLRPSDGAQDTKSKPRVKATPVS